MTLLLLVAAIVITPRHSPFRLFRNKPGGRYFPIPEHLSHLRTTQTPAQLKKAHFFRECGSFLLIHSSTITVITRVRPSLLLLNLCVSEFSQLTQSSKGERFPPSNEICCYL